MTYMTVRGRDWKRVGSTWVLNRPGLALDRTSVRSVDINGRLHVAVANISKGNVCGYLGAEIPDAARLGLDQNRIYQVLRDPDELAKAAPTFNNIPLLFDHMPVSADDHRPDLVVGSTGTDARFASPYLQNSLVFWAAHAIDAINSGAKRELSASYHYKPVMQPGTFQGVRYDIRMTALLGNHVSIVDQGRAGPDVLVADAALQTQDTDMDDTTKQNVLRYLQDSAQLPSAHLEAVSRILDGDADESGEDAVAQDRRRRAAASIAADRARAPERAKMFPNANRLR